MTFSRFLLPGLAALALFAAGEAAAQSAGSDQRRDRIFAVLDQNNDSRITAAEFESARSPAFGRMDRDRDGALSHGEFVRQGADRDRVLSAREERRRAIRIDAFRDGDRDGDGRISLPEFRNMGRAEFAAIDGDGDGAISGPEFRAYRPSRAARPADPARAARRGIFARLDGNDDGVVTAAEMDDARAATFGHQDGDANGTLSPGEFLAGRSAAGAPAPPAIESLKLKRDARFLALDWNRDGVIDREEYLADGRRRFASADRNGDGRMTEDEFAAAAAAAAARGR